MQICAVKEGYTWMTPYRRYLDVGILPLEPEEGKKIKRNSAKVHLCGSGAVQTWVHPSNLGVCERRPVYMNND